MMIHAFFKRMLFLRRGSLISQNGGGQDSRFYGGERWMGGSYLYFITSCLGLSGFPFVIGFYSKDSMLRGVGGLYGGIFYLSFLLRCGLTVIYSLRLVFIGYQFGRKGFPSKISDEDLFFVLPVYLLFFVCCFLGNVLSWFFLSGEGVAFRGVDYLVGLILVSVFSFYSFCFKAVSVFPWFLGGISFLGWIRTGGVSSSIKKFFIQRGEVS